VDNMALSGFWIWLASPVVFALVVMSLLFIIAAPSLRLEHGKKNKFWSWVAKVFGIGLIAVFMLSTSASQVLALPTSTAMDPSISISLDVKAKTVQASDSIAFKSKLTNHGTEASTPLIVAMNIINLDVQGQAVEPEDWSLERTQYIKGLAPGQSAMLNWRVHAMLDGDYMLYLVVIPEPAGQELMTQPIASSGIHLTVTPFTRLSPRGALPYSVGAPVLLLVVIYFVNRRRNRQIDAGGS
jgi:hypothetical protein